VISCAIRDGPSNPAAGFSQSFSDFPLLIIIPSLLHTHLSKPNEVYDKPDQAAHYHILGLQVWGFETEMSTRNLRGCKGRPARKADKLTAIYEPSV
jgi:hypothetical protein